MKYSSGCSLVKHHPHFPRISKAIAFLCAGDGPATAKGLLHQHLTINCTVVIKGTEQVAKSYKNKGSFLLNTVVVASARIRFNNSSSRQQFPFLGPKILPFNPDRILHHTVCGEAIFIWWVMLLCRPVRCDGSVLGYRWYESGIRCAAGCFTKRTALSTVK